MANAPVAKRTTSNHITPNSVTKTQSQRLSRKRSLPRNSQTMARNIKSSNVAVTEAALILKLGMGTYPKGVWWKWQSVWPWDRQTHTPRKRSRAKTCRKPWIPPYNLILLFFKCNSYGHFFNLASVSCFVVPVGHGG